MIPNLGPWEILLILLVVLLVFGAKRLPEMGAAMGKGIREFKRNITEMKDSIEKGDTSSGAPPRQLDSASHVDTGDPKKLSE